jgi:hypothetical protein
LLGEGVIPLAPERNILRLDVTDIRRQSICPIKPKFGRKAEGVSRTDLGRPGDSIEPCGA